MAGMLSQAFADDWSELLRTAGPQGVFVSGSQPASSFSSLASSGASSSSGSLGDLTRCSSGSSGSAQDNSCVTQVGPARDGLLRQPGPAAQLPCQAGAAAGALPKADAPDLLLRPYTCFDGLDFSSLHLAAAAIAASAAPAAASLPAAVPAAACPAPAAAAPLLVQQQATRPYSDAFSAAVPSPLAIPQPILQPAALYQQQKHHPQTRQQQPVPFGSMPLPPPLAPAAMSRPAFSCAACSCAFVDAAAFHLHCASLEHTMNLLQDSLALKGPRGMATAAGASFDTRQATSPAPGMPRNQPFNAAVLGSTASRQGPGLSHPTAAGACFGAPLQLAPAPGGLGLPAPPLHGFACLTACLNQVIDPQLDALCHGLLKQMRQLDGVERAPGGSRCQAGASKALRRVVGGLREVRKSVKCGAAVAVIAAVDIQEVNPCARCASQLQPGAEIAEICQLASAGGIPVVFALTRISLGSIFGANKRMSAVALTNITGLEPAVERVLQLAAQARSRFALLTGQTTVAVRAY